MLPWEIRLYNFEKNTCLKKKRINQFSNMITMVMDNNAHRHLTLENVVHISGSFMFSGLLDTAAWFPL